MKVKCKILFAVCAISCAVAALASGCAKKTDYLKYVSEKRTDIFLYEDDEVSVKIHCSQKEQPYAADGICGSVSPLAEVFVSLPKTYDKVEISLNGYGGEMNYQAVQSVYFLSFSASPFEGDGVDVNLVYGENEKTYRALNVKQGTVMSCDDAVFCVAEHAKELFASLTENGIFSGEIFVRLLYDEGCYYYVGVCDRQKHVTAYLIDGEHGKVIATREMQG